MCLRLASLSPVGSLPTASSSPPLEGAEVELAQGVLDEPLLVVVGERLARDLLGREHRQVGDLAADLIDRAAGLGLDVAPRLLEQALALGAGGLDRLLLVRLTGLAGAGDDLIGLCAGLGEPLAVLVEHLLGLLAQLLGGVDLARSLGARVERRADDREHRLAQHQERRSRRRPAPRSSAPRWG